jgi:hypothetical protein
MHPGAGYRLGVVRHRTAFCIALLVCLVGTGCGSNTKSTTPTTSSATTTAASGSVYGKPGNYTVGVTTLRTGNEVEVWYPANGGVGVGVGGDTYDVRSFLPPAVAKRLAPKVHALVSTVANRGAVVGSAGEQFPLVLFSQSCC